MPAASLTKFEPFVADKNNGEHNLGSDTLRVALTNTAPVATQGAFDPGTNHPPPAAANGYPTGGGALTLTSSTQTGGVYKLVVADFVFTATAGGIGPFRYAVLYNDTNASDKAIGFYDYGSSITVGDGETFTFDADPTNGLFTDT